MSKENELNKLENYIMLKVENIQYNGDCDIIIDIDIDCPISTVQILRYALNHFEEGLNDNKINLN